ncbi:hypothetical protein Hanom_Chr02g00103051 [Helianthus anomalus]
MVSKASTIFQYFFRHFSFEGVPAISVLNNLNVATTTTLMKVVHKTKHTKQYHKTKKTSAFVIKPVVL